MKASDGEEFGGYEAQLENRRRKRRRLAESEDALQAAASCALLSILLILCAFVLLILSGDPTPVDETLRIRRDAFDGSTNGCWLLVHSLQLRGSVPN